MKYLILFLSLHLTAQTEIYKVDEFGIREDLPSKVIIENKVYKTEYGIIETFPEYEIKTPVQQLPQRLEIQPIINNVLDSNSSEYFSPNLDN